MHVDFTSMDIAILQVLADPAIIIFILCTIVATVGKFLRSWIISCMIIILFGLLIIVIAVTAGQIAGLDEQIRYLITARYSIFSAISLTLRDIILMVFVIFAFQLALALHVTRADVEFQKKFFWLPRRHIRHYEMEYTFESLLKKFKDK